MVTINKPVSYIDEVHGEIVFSGYHYAKYGGLDVIVNKDGLINLNKLCYLYTDKNGEHTKDYSDWLADEGEDYIKCFRRLHTEEGGNPDKFLIEVTGPDCISGYYGIVNLAQQVASWTCPKFAWKMARIYKNHIAEQAKQK